MKNKYGMFGTKNIAKIIFLVILVLVPVGIIFGSHIGYPNGVTVYERLSNGQPSVSAYHYEARRGPDQYLPVDRYYVVAHMVRNFSANRYFIGTQTSGEFSSFISRPPPGVDFFGVRIAECSDGIDNEGDGLRDAAWRSSLTHDPDCQYDHARTFEDGGEGPGVPPPPTNNNHLAFSSNTSYVDINSLVNVGGGQFGEAHSSSHTQRAQNNWELLHQYAFTAPAGYTRISVQVAHFGVRSRWSTVSVGKRLRVEIVGRQNCASEEFAGGLDTLTCSIFSSGPLAVPETVNVYLEARSGIAIGQEHLEDRFSQIRYGFN